MSNEPSLSDEAKSLAEKVDAGIRNGGYAEESFKAICSEIDAAELADNLKFMTVSVEDVAYSRFVDSELCAYDGIDELDITDELRLGFMRSHLSAEIGEPDEYTSSAHWKEIALSSNESLFCCALVHIEGYIPIISWWGAYLSLDEFYTSLKLNGYVLSDSDVDALSDECLLAY